LIKRDRFGVRLDANYQHLFAGGPDLEFFPVRAGIIFYRRNDTWLCPPHPHSLVGEAGRKGRGDPRSKSRWGGYGQQESLLGQIDHVAGGRSRAAGRDLICDHARLGADDCDHHLFHSIRLILYYFHERIWESIDWGRRKHPLASLPVTEELKPEDLKAVQEKLRELGYLE